MIADRKTLSKLEVIAKRYDTLRFYSIKAIPVAIHETHDYLHAEPPSRAGVTWKAVKPGIQWGDSWKTAWFRGDVTLPGECAGKKVYVRAQTGANGQTLFFINGVPGGAFDENHPVVLLSKKGIARKKYHLSFEAYAGHNFPGCMPDSPGVVVNSSTQTFKGIELVIEREDVTAFYFDMVTLLSLAKSLDPGELRYGKIAGGLMQVFKCIDAKPEERTEDEWRPKLKKARAVMNPLLKAVNGSTAPQFGIVGNSHIDTAWLWPLAETIRKCGRTFSAMLALLDEYPEFIFIQSAPCHADMARTYYPEVFKKMKQMVKTGRWEPNGAMWIEPDANIPSGESMIRQFLLGQTTTRTLFGYTADTLWLPDVFGYSAALPQIMKGCNVQFFCTQKISWNDTTRFPYDTFYWQGIDGTQVFSHFLTDYVISPNPETLTRAWERVQHKDVQDRQLCAFGYGDGGGGPTREQIGIIRRMGDLEGCPRCRYTTVSTFMQTMQRELQNIPVFAGELYLEGHRGTLTSIAELKRGNRKAECALRDCEFICTLAALRGKKYPSDAIQKIWKNVLTNQFHDILPGSSIARTNDEAIAMYSTCIDEAREISLKAGMELSKGKGEHVDSVLCINTLSWDRQGEIILSNIPSSVIPADNSLHFQKYRDIEGKNHLALEGVTLPALGSAILPLKQARLASRGKTPFTVSAKRVETPYAKVRFDRGSGIESYVCKQTGRELVNSGSALNALLMGEDVPLAWDNWDIDRDHEMKLEYSIKRLSRKVISNGPLQLRIRSTYRISETSTIEQDMVFHAGTERIDFETKVIWHEKHRLLKAAFPLALHTDTARHEIQYGHVERPTHRNHPQDAARFEICAHKWTDLSEGGYGVALLNDCKYGVGVNGSEIRLSLLKSGTHPDERGNAGTQYMTYSLLPHTAPFSVEQVVRPAYEVNVPVVAIPSGDNAVGHNSLIRLDAGHVIVESVKWAESGDGFVIRVYEAENCTGLVTMTLGVPVAKVEETNMLEEPIRKLRCEDGKITFRIRPFEIKTYKCTR